MIDHCDRFVISHKLPIGCPLHPLSTEKEEAYVIVNYMHKPVVIKKKKKGSTPRPSEDAITTATSTTTGSICGSMNSDNLVTVVVGGVEFQEDCHFLCYWFDYFKAGLRQSGGDLSWKESRTKCFELDFPALVAAESSSKRQKEDYNPAATEWEWIKKLIDPVDTDKTIIQSWKEMKIALQWFSVLCCPRGLEMCNNHPMVLSSQENNESNPPNLTTTICDVFLIARDHCLHNIIQQCCTLLTSNKDMAWLPLLMKRMDHHHHDTTTTTDASAADSSSQASTTNNTEQTATTSSSGSTNHHKEDESKEEEDSFSPPVTRQFKVWDTILSEDILPNLRSKLIGSAPLPRQKRQRKWGISRTTPRKVPNSQWKDFMRIIDLFKLANQYNLQQSKKICYEIVTKYYGLKDPTKRRWRWRRWLLLHGKTTTKKNPSPPETNTPLEEEDTTGSCMVQFHNIHHDIKIFKTVLELWPRDVDKKFKPIQKKGYITTKQIKTIKKICYQNTSGMKFKTYNRCRVWFDQHHRGSKENNITPVLHIQLVSVDIEMTPGIVGNYMQQADDDSRSEISV